MGKRQIGRVKELIIVEGDANLLKPNEILLAKSNNYSILRKRNSSGKIDTFVIIPLSEL